MSEQLYYLDSYCAILCLLGKLKFSSCRCAPFNIVLLHQLYCLVRNRTQLTEELNRLREGNLIIMFTCRLSNDSFGIMLTSDYTALLLTESKSVINHGTSQTVTSTSTSSGARINSGFSNSAADKSSPADSNANTNNDSNTSVSAFEKFAHWILQCNDIHAHLHSNMDDTNRNNKSSYSVLKSTLLGYNNSNNRFTRNGTGTMAPMTPDDIQTLLRAGYLFPRRDTAGMCSLNMPLAGILAANADNDRATIKRVSATATGSHSNNGLGVDELFWISHPQLSQHCQNILEGREIIMKLIAKAKFHELSENKLIKMLAVMQREQEKSETLGVGKDGNITQSGRKRSYAQTLAADIDRIVRSGRSPPVAGMTTQISAIAGTFTGESSIDNSNGNSTTNMTLNSNSLAILPYEVRYHLYDLLGAKLIERVNRRASPGGNGNINTGNSGRRLGHYGEGLENSAGVGGDNILRLLKPSK